MDEMIKNKPRKSVLFWLNIILLVVVAGLALFIVWKEYLHPYLNNGDSDNNTKTTDTVQSNLETVDPQKTTDLSISETAGWKTYRDDFWDFEMKYPIDWRLVLSGKNDEINTRLIQLYPSNGPELREKLEIGIYGSSLDFDSLIKSGSQDNKIYTEYSSTEKNQIRWSFGEVTGDTSFDGDFFHAIGLSKNIYKDDPAKKIELSASGYSLDNQREILKGILSSIEFTN